MKPIKITNKLLKKIYLLLLLNSIYFSEAQIKEGQDFCSEINNESYFPLSIDKKKILWYNTFYTETKGNNIEIKGKKYTEFKQEWEDKSTSIIYLREENGVVIEYDKSTEKETIRFDPNFEIKYQWISNNFYKNYKILSYNGELKTPFCKYTNLLVIEASTTDSVYQFYYFKGHGYIGATKNGKIISCVTPIWD